MKALLVRVGIDRTSGEWNAPVNPVTYEFAYVPIPENEGTVVYSEYKRTYEEFKKPCEKLGCPLPSKVIEKYTSVHLDPDFQWLTYGDAGQKGKQLKEAGLSDGDILVFYASLKPTSSPKGKTGDLIYAIIGLYVLGKPGVPAKDIPKENWHVNAHTRREPKDDDIVFFGKKGLGLSGRLERCIQIGEYIAGKYWLKQRFFNEWECFSFPRKGVVTKLCLQRSGALPHFCNAKKFYEWFRNQNNRLVECNNPLATGD